MIARRVRIIVGCVWASVGLVGCASSALPVYPDMPPRKAVSVLRSRLESVHTITASGTLTLQSESMDVVRLDAVVIAAPPHRLRLKAWKFGRTAIDITVLEDGTWAIPLDSPSASPINVHDFLPAASALRSDCLSSASVVESPADPSLILISSTDCDMQCEIDRRTITVRSISELSARTRTLDFSDYQMVDQQPWPMTLKASHKHSQATLHFDTMEINGVLSDEAFIPSSRAVRMP